MPATAATSPLPQPVEPDTNATVVATGLPVAAIDRIRLMDASEWEDFILEWATTRHGKYARVERCGGAGDMGRDVICIADENGYIWDNFQCKHYARPLAPSDIWIELGKLAFHSFSGEYTVPRSYTFVSPHGAGTKLSGLLRNPDKLRDGLTSNWASHCQTKIASQKQIPLEDALLRHIQAIDFRIFDSLPPLTLVNEHRASPYHIPRFGGGLPPRPEVASPPRMVQGREAPYVEALLRAYGDHLKTSIVSREDIRKHSNLSEHFDDSRYEFYSAEALRAFSRDHLPETEFEELQNLVHHGVRPDFLRQYPDGLACLVAVVKCSQGLQLNAHSLSSVLSIRDRGGICHQLANDRKISWVAK